MEQGELYARIARMRETAVLIGHSAATINDCMDAIEREVYALRADRFMSIGAESFRGEYDRLKPKLHDAVQQIRAFQEKLDTAASDIEAAARAAHHS